MGGDRRRSFTGVTIHQVSNQSRSDMAGARTDEPTMHISLDMTRARGAGNQAHFSRGPCERRIISVNLHRLQ